MLSTNLYIIDELKRFLQCIVDDSELLSLFSTNSKCFKRRRKLPFDRLVLLIARLCKKTLSVELESFFNEFGLQSSCSVSAFCQQRLKLKPVFFRVWNELLCNTFYSQTEKVKTWRSYRIVAVDGSNMSLVNTPALQTYFGGQRNQQCFFAQAKAMYCYDVLNRLQLRAELVPYRTGELTVAYKMVDWLQQDMLAIYDRNFCNYKMMALHSWQETERKFVIRAKEKQETIRRFIGSHQQTAVILMTPTPSAIEGLRQHGFIIDKNTLLKVRLVRVELPGTVEVLATNLWEEEGYENQLFKELYFLRWGIETNIGHQKNILQLEAFSGLSPLSVEQDFYATVFTANLHSIIVAEAQQQIDAKPRKGKYVMKINGNKSYGKLKANFIRLFLSNSTANILQLLEQYFVRDTLPIRPGRSFQRVIKNKQSKSKHKMFMNFKPAF